MTPAPCAITPDEYAAACADARARHATFTLYGKPKTKAVVVGDRVLFRFGEVHAAIPAELARDLEYQPHPSAELDE